MPVLAFHALGLRLRLAYVGRPRHVSSSRPQHAGETPVAIGERPLGCGWFDSSLDLAAGLSVQEHASVEAVAGELPLADWLHFHAQGWRGAPLR